MRWLDRWRIARCVDEGRDLPPGLASRVSASPELSEYRSELRRVERMLRRADAPRGPAPAGLHGQVMDRIRAERPLAAHRRARPGFWPALAAAAVGAAVLTVPLIPTGKSQAPTPGPAAPTGASEIARGLRAAPAAIARTPVEGPLVEEARLLERETRRMADMVLASFPSGVARR